MHFQAAVCQASRKPHTPSMPADSSKKPDPATSRFYVTAVERAMAVLMAFDGMHRHLSLSQLAESTGLDVSAMQRFTHTLQALGYLRRDPQSKKFELSAKLLDFSNIYLSANEMLAKAMPYLQRLAQDTEEVVNLSVLDGTDMILISRIVSRNALNLNIHVGSRMPAFCTASGLAWLSALPDDEAEAVLRASDLVAHTQHTETSLPKIRKRLAQARKNGYVHTGEEYRLGGVATAAAICDAQGRVQGAISISVSKPRWNAPEDEKRYADLVIATCAAISTQRLAP
jgi:DNA-binding IclR family transcriptional regulator